MVACDSDVAIDDSPAAKKSIKATIGGNTQTTEDVTARIYEEADAEKLVIQARFKSGSVTSTLELVMYSNSTSNPIDKGEYKVGSQRSFAIGAPPIAALCIYFNAGSPRAHASTFTDRDDAGRVVITTVDRGSLLVTGSFDAIVTRNSSEIRFEKGSFTEIPLIID